MSGESTWAQTLLDPTQEVASGLITWNKSDPERRFAVYRNNVVVSLVDALAHTFPVTLELVGAEFFRAMAQVFVRAHPPRTKILTHYGDGLPDFIAHFPPAAGLPYLADVARLETLRLQALHAADAEPLDTATIASALQDADSLPHMHWQMAPSLHLIRSQHAAVSIWAAHQEGSELELDALETEVPESALVFRSEWDVMVLQAAPGLTALVADLLAKSTFGDAMEQAFAADPDFDLTQALATLIRHGLLVGLEKTH